MSAHTLACDENTSSDDRKHPIKVLFVQTSCNGGAGIASERILSALRKNLPSDEFCFSQLTGDSWFQHLSIPFRAHRKINHLLMRFSRTDCTSFRSMDERYGNALQEIIALDCDIVHLHWINEILSIRDIAAIRKPVVWTMHDSWAFCGTEHHPELLRQDTRYLAGYTRDNFPEYAKGLDVDRWIWEKKKKCWKDLKDRFVFTAPGTWEAQCFTKSALFSGVPCHVIHNTIDLDVFHPVSLQEKNRLRNQFGIPCSAEVVLFGAQNPAERLKGSSFLLKALQELKKRKNLFLFGFGSAESQFLQECGIPFVNAGRKNCDSDLAALYQAADVFVCPSIIESFSNTTLEAISCGIPAVAFRIGGPCDMICHQENGYLATPYEPSDLAKGIRFCLENQEILSGKARKIAVENFSEAKIAGQYAELYRKVLKK